MPAFLLNPAACGGPEVGWTVARAHAAWSIWPQLIEGSAVILVLKEERKKEFPIMLVNIREWDNKVMSYPIIYIVSPYFMHMLAHCMYNPWSKSFYVLLNEHDVATYAVLPKVAMSPMK